MNHGVTISGVGAYAPPGLLTNEDLEKLVDTSDEWIVQRTGMKRRHIAAPDEATSDLAIPAAFAALDAAKRTPADIQCVIVATATPDYLFPATACIVAASLGIPGAAAFDMSIGCSGFVYALTTAAALIRSGVYERILVIGAETLSKVRLHRSRDVRAVRRRRRRRRGRALRGGLLSRQRARRRGSDPQCSICLAAAAAFRTTRRRAAHERLGYIHMQGQAVFKFAVQQMAGSVQTALAKAGLTPADVDFVVPHQANKRIVDATMKMLGCR